MRYVNAFGVFVFLFILWCVGWIGATAVYRQWTNAGAVYEANLVPLDSPLVPSLVTVSGTSEFFLRRWDEKSHLLELDVFVAKRIAVTAIVGRTEAIQAVLQDAKACGSRRTIGYSIAWQFSGTAAPEIRNLYGADATSGCMFLSGFEAPVWWAPYARDVAVDVPRGGLVPLVSLILTRGMRGLNESTDSKVEQALTDRLAREIAERLRYRELEISMERIAYLYGPVQFATLALFFFSALIALVSFWSTWAREAAEQAMNLIPYVGFFGTLLGMGAALRILGQANLSDPISKAINLGPIGSQLALAIETTKFALVCFGLATLFVLVRDAIRKTDAKSTRDLSSSGQ